MGYANSVTAKLIKTQVAHPGRIGGKKKSGGEKIKGLYKQTQGEHKN